MSEENVPAVPVEEAGAQVVPSKPWDLRVLKGKVVSKCTPKLAGLVESAAEGVVEWAQESIEQSESKVDDLLLGLISKLKGLVK